MFIKTISAGNGFLNFNKKIRAMKKKIIRKYATFVALEGLAISFFFATYQLFLVEKGLSLLEINLLNACYMLANFCFEIPTGAIADFFGRRRSVIIGLWLFAFSFLLYFFAESFWQFLAAEIIGALAATCISGAAEALVFDSVKSEDRPGYSQELFAKAEVRTIGTIIGVLIGSYAAGFNLAWPWLLSAITFSLLALTAPLLLPPEEKRTETILQGFKLKSGLHSLKNVAVESVIYGWKNSRLMNMICFVAILSFAIMPINMYWPLLLKNNFALPTRFMGLVFTGIALSVYGGAQLAKFWSNKIKCKKNAIFFSQIITFVGLISCLLFVQLSSFLIFFLLHEVGRGVLKPLYRDYVHTNIDSRYRATIVSFESMIITGASALGLVISGLLANNYGILFTWAFSALVILFSIVFFYKGNNKASNPSS